MRLLVSIHICILPRNQATYEINNLGWLYSTNPYRMYAVLGMHDREMQDGIRFNFEKVFVHPQFTSYSNYDTYDAAIIKTDRLIEFSNKIIPICLPSEGKCTKQVVAKQNCPKSDWRT